MYVSEFSKYLLLLEQNSSRIKIKEILRDLFDQIHTLASKERQKDLYFIAAYFLTGNLVPEFIPIEFGLQERTIFEILKNLQRKLKSNYELQKGPDLGDLWYEFITEFKIDLEQNKKYPLRQVYKDLLDIALVSGKGSMAKKTELLIKLLTSIDPLSGKYVIRLILGKLRLGVNFKSILDAVSDYLLSKIRDYEQIYRLDKELLLDFYLNESLQPSDKEDVLNIKQIKDFLTYLYGVTNDIGLVIYIVFNSSVKDLVNVSATAGIPIASQLAEREKNIQHVFARIPSPVLEPKYDGLRGQVHLLTETDTSKKNVIRDVTTRVWYKAYKKVLKQEQELNLLTSSYASNRKDIEYMIFSRNATNLSNMFPEVEHDMALIKQYLENKNIKWLQDLLLGNYKQVLIKKAIFQEDLDALVKRAKLSNFKLAQTAKILPREIFLKYVEARIVKLGSSLFTPSVILDSEIIGYDENTGEFIPFQQTISRRRKYGISKKAQAIPVRFYVFDLMFLGVDIIQLPFALRRFLLEYLFNEVSGLSVLKLTPEHNIKFMNIQTAENLFDYYVEAGLEGIMFKDPIYNYSPGVRNFAWIKYKRAMKGELADSLDVVVLGYYKGRGRRASLGIGALLIGVYDRDKNIFVSISKLGTGITDDQWIRLKQLLDKYKANNSPVNVEIPKELAPDIWVYPKVVMEVEADEITKSPLHTAGYALRFPRFKQLRQDKDPEQATTKQEVEEMYNLSKNK